MSYTLLVADIDGTLTNKAGAISKEDRDALAKAKQLGVNVSLCTGRVPQACKDVFEALQPEGLHIFSDGALVCDINGKNVIYEKPIPATLLREIIDYVLANRIRTIEFFSATRHFIAANTEGWFIRIRHESFGLNPEVTDFSNIWQRGSIIKATMVASTPTEKDKMEKLRKYFHNKIHFSPASIPAYPDMPFVNITDPNVSKGEALSVLASHLGVSRSEIMAIGDGKNDIPLLENAGLAVAMGNADPELKSVANHITLDVEQSGLAAAVKKFLLS